MNEPNWLIASDGVNWYLGRVNHYKSHIIYNLINNPIIKMSPVSLIENPTKFQNGFVLIPQSYSYKAIYIKPVAIIFFDDLDKTEQDLNQHIINSMTYNCKSTDTL